MCDGAPHRCGEEGCSLIPFRCGPWLSGLRRHKSLDPAETIADDGHAMGVETTSGGMQTGLLYATNLGAGRAGRIPGATRWGKA